MNARERLLIVALSAVVGVGGFAIGTYLWFVKPLFAYNKAIATLRDETDLEQTKWDTFKFEHKRLELARLKSLPANPSDAASVYNYYLEKIVIQSGLALGSIQPSAPVKVKPVSAIPNVKEVGHQLMTFTLTARGDLAELVNLMELLQTTPYEHRIRSLGIDRADQAVGKGAGKKLVVTMVIETLLVAKNENRPGHPPGVNTECLIVDHIAGRSMLAPMGWGLIGNRLAVSQATPTPANRRYADIAKKNIFVGAVPIEKISGGGFVKKKEEKPSPGNIPRYIRLVHTVPTQQEAYLINLFYRNEELKLSANPKTGYQVRRISDDNGDYIFCFMKVLRVDSGVVYFQVKDEVYAIELGQTLDDALHDPLTEEEMIEMGLSWDAVWAREQMKDTKGGSTTKKKGNKGN
jgi:hypothetical protein